MIYYFSGTGNSKWAAFRLGEALSEECAEICCGFASVSCKKEKVTGIVFPVYAWAPPELVMDFAGRLKHSCGFAFAVATCGSEAGKSLKMLSSVFALDSAYSIVMPNNYIIGSDPDTAETALPKIKKAEDNLKRISEEISAGQKIWRVNEGAAAGLKSTVISRGFNRFARRTGPFRADAKCDGCGLCKDVCPVGTISLEDDGPVWNSKCCQCLACINRCPQEAIQYGRNTEGKARYYIEKVL